MEPFSMVVYLVGTAVAGVLGGRSDAVFTGALRATHPRLKVGPPPTNHDLHRAVRRSILQATSVVCEAYHEAIDESALTKTPGFLHGG